MFHKLAKIWETFLNRVRWKLAKKRSRSEVTFDPVNYWNSRARRFGRRSVLNLGHSDNDFDNVTKLQWDTLLPFLQHSLNGKEQIVLDFGCGPGRFTDLLAKLVNGVAMGVDISSYLISEATSGNVGGKCSFKVIDPNSKLPFQNEFDLIFICLTLGGCSESQIAWTCHGIEDALKPGGLLFVVENTQPERPSAVYWTYRSPTDYCLLFKNVSLECVGEYYDLQERISVMVGRKRANF